MAATPYRSPRANAVCERWIGSARREALDWLLLTCERHLRRVLVKYNEDDNLAQSHRSLGFRAPPAEEDPGRADRGECLPLPPRRPAARILAGGSLIVADSISAPHRRRSGRDEALTTSRCAP